MNNPKGEEIPAYLGPIISKLVGDKASKYIAPKTETQLAIEKQQLLMKVNDYDSRTMAQLAAEEFSGLRANNTWLRFELWLRGRLHAELGYHEFWDKPQRLYEFYLDAFGLKEVALEAETYKAIVEVEARKANAYIREELLKGKKL